MRLRSGGDPYDWLFLAMVHAKRGRLDAARQWYGRALARMRPHPPEPHGELARFQAEASRVLGIEPALSK
jgi:hypothetical protein